MGLFYNRTQIRASPLAPSFQGHISYNTKWWVNNLGLRTIFGVWGKLKNILMFSIYNRDNKPYFPEINQTIIFLLGKPTLR